METTLAAGMSSNSATPGPLGNLADRAGTLLQRLGFGVFAVQADVPEAILDAMTDLQQVLLALRPVKPPDSNGPLEPEGGADDAESADGEGHWGDAMDDEEQIFSDLLGADEGNDEALLGIARRPKRVRHT